MKRRIVSKIVSAIMVAGIALSTIPLSGVSAATNYYRVRESWGNAASQIGAYTVLDNAIKQASGRPGYEVYDWNGKQVWPSTSTPAPTPPPSTGSSEQTYTVKSGDSWWGIGQKFGINYNTIATYNGKTSSTTIYVGQVLKIPGTGNGGGTTTPSKPTPTPAPSTPPAGSNEQTYTVKAGDSWWAIGQKFGINYNTIATYNGKTSSTTIYVGQVLKIPGTGSGSTTPTPPPTAASIRVAAQAARSAPSSTSSTKVYDQPGIYVTLRATTFYEAVNSNPSQSIGAGSYINIQSIHKNGSDIWGKAHTGAFFPIKVGSTAYMEKRNDPGYQAIPTVEKGAYTVTQLPSTVWNGVGMGYVIKTPNGKTVMIDGGFQTINNATNGTVSGYATGEEANLLNFLKQNGSTAVDYWFWTHLHNDHVNTSAALINKGQVSVGKLFATTYPARSYADQTAAEKQYVENARTKMKNAGKYQNVARGNVFTIDGLKIEILSANTGNWRENDESLVMKLTFGNTGKTMLITGDNLLLLKNSYFAVGN